MRRLPFPAWRPCALSALLLAAVIVCCPARSQDSPARESDRAILVMISLAPPHFRPDSDYGGSDDASSARDASRETAGRVAREHGLRIRSDWAMPALKIQCFAMEVPPGASVAGVIQALEKDGNVESVQRVQRFRALDRPDPLYSFQPSAARWHLDQLHEAATGRSVRVAVIDSGVDRGQPDLREQDIAARNFVEGPDRPERHGTAVAGIVLARPGNGIGIAGIAPQARLIALRACSEEEGGTFCDSFSLAKALQFAIEERAQVINMSLGGPYDRLLDRLLEAARGRGVAVVAAVDPREKDGAFPASSRFALAVADEDAPPPEAGLVGILFAPGTHVPTTVPGERWDFVDGSSFAAAHVTGLVALLLELNPDLAPGEIAALLASSPVPVSQGARPGRVEACAALARVARHWKGCRTPPPSPALRG